MTTSLESLNPGSHVERHWISPASFGKYEVYFSVFAGLVHLACGMALLTWRVGRCFYDYVTQNDSNTPLLAHSFEIHPGDHLARGVLLIFVFIIGGVGFYLLDKYDAWWFRNGAIESEIENLSQATEEQVSTRSNRESLDSHSDCSEVSSVGSNPSTRGSSEGSALSSASFEEDLDSLLDDLTVFRQEAGKSLEGRNLVMENAKQFLQEGDYRKSLEKFSLVAFYAEGALESIHRFSPEYHLTEVHFRDAQMLAAECCEALAAGIPDPEAWGERIGYYHQAAERYRKASLKTVRSPAVREELFMKMVKCYQKIAHEYSASNQHDRALELFKEAVVLSQKGPFRECSAEFRVFCTAEYGKELRKAGYPEQAAEYFLVLAQYCEEGEEWYALAKECYLEAIEQFGEELSLEQLERCQTQADLIEQGLFDEIMPNSGLT